METLIKTQETIVSNTCNKCNGIGKPSKALVNFHNIRLSYRKGEKEFYTSLINCIKCQNCGHSWTN